MMRVSSLRWLWWTSVLVVYLGLACWQLGLPGLHYDEAREAGVNAMELLTGAPVTAFRDAALHVSDLRLPLMVQDYIGALNVYLALPILWLSGIGVPNLRILSVATGLLTLIVLERSVSEWLATRRVSSTRAPAPSIGGLAAMTLAACSPAFVFWSRQGIFVTNVMVLLTLLSVWLGVRWLRTGSERTLLLAIAAGGLALYAKLLAAWVLAPFWLLALVGYWRLCRTEDRKSPKAATWVGAVCVLLLTLTPLLLFNLQTGGTWQAVAGNLGQSYYGVENADLLSNLGVRLPQVWQVLEGSFLWYLGGIQANPVAPWLALVVVTAGIWRSWRRVLPPLLVVVGAFVLSLVTISDLFITHYALLQVVLLGVVGTALGVLVEEGLRTSAQKSPGAENVSAATPPVQRRFSLGGIVVAGVLLLWVALDARATIGYHRLLAASGGLADHSDATYHLAYHLQHNGMGSPIALDWGMDATVRFLSGGAVTPIEVFGYDSLEAPDAEFEARLSQFIENRDNVYLLHAPEAEVFRGRREQLVQSAAAHALAPERVAEFAQRDGTPLFEIWRLEPAAEIER